MISNGESKTDAVRAREVLGNHRRQSQHSRLELGLCQRLIPTASLPDQAPAGWKGWAECGVDGNVVVEIPDRCLATGGIVK